jgi:hypothetical protein
MATYDTGDQVRVTATFTSGGIGTNPSTIVTTHRKPDGTDTDVSESASGSGVYTADVTLDQVGVHTIKFAGTGAVIATEVVELEVAKNVFDHS